MEPLLSKNEIADLLRAIKEGHIATDATEPEQAAKFTNAKSIDLFHATNKSSHQQRIPNFDIILDSFAQNYSISLTNQLQRTFTISRIDIESAIFNEFMTDPKNSGAIGVINLDPLKYGALLIFNQQLSFTMIEIMLGASSEIDPVKLDRKLTTIELNILKSVMTKACENLTKAMSPLINLNSSLIKIENNPRLVSITDPESEVLICRFQVKIGSLSGELKMLFPVATLEPLRERLKDLLSVRTSHFSEWSRLIMDQILEMPTTIIAQSGALTLPLHKVLAFKKGDIIPLDYDPNAPLKVLIEDNLKFFARPGVHAGKKAINLTGVY
ncbi:MAG: FliM/FliN family flagellar motor switch protein [Proteobacteria bacterium]|nr:FliM/FliN family flagellar motor switch protein [Pseudomonadota bacterium]MBU1649777.1 FliM/FliN family flagellar motor switch protein [Pseudomonadota bacterium]